MSDTEFILGPTYRSSRESKPGPDVPRGALHPLTMHSKDSTMYPGVAKDLDALADMDREEYAKYGGVPPGVEPSLPEVVPYTRELAVYVPAGHDSAAAAPFIVVNDGMGWVEGVAPTLDTLIAEGRIPPIVAVFVDSGGDDSVGSQRGLEYDSVSGLFAEFLETEVLPHVESEVGIKLTKDPEGRAVLGGSSGGACAFSCAWFRPDLFRRVLCYSGTFVNQQSPFNPEYPAGAWEYHSGLNLVGTSVKKPLKICLCECPFPFPTQPRPASLCSPSQLSADNPQLDNGHEATDESYHNWVTANFRMAAALKERQYDYRHVVCQGAGHVDGRLVVQTMADALEWLWGGFEPG